MEGETNITASGAASTALAIDKESPKGAGDPSQQETASDQPQSVSTEIALEVSDVPSSALTTNDSGEDKDESTTTTTSLEESQIETKITTNNNNNNNLSESKPTIVELPEMPKSVLPSKKASKDGNGDDDDVKSKAAVALAAVAAAASASHKSPAEAAREARAVAHTFISTAADENNDQSQRKRLGSNQQEIKTVLLKDIRSELVKRDNPSFLIQKMRSGENDSLLQTLLLLDYFRAVEDPDISPAFTEPSVEVANGASEQEKVRRVQDACDRLEATIRKVDGAYQSLVDLLPKLQSDIVEDLEGEFNDPERPVVVPDLLPPCSPSKGDPTITFFRACMGDMAFGDQDRRVFSTEAKPAEQEGGQEHESNKGEETQNNPTKVANSMFASMFRRAAPKPKANLKSESWSKNEEVQQLETAEHSCDDANPDYYEVRIEREMLGLTVENVLERTVVRTVAPGGPARKAGAKVGSLIVKVANIETKNLTHFETIDELRQSNRPLNLVLRPIAEEALRSAREEMGRLIKGSGFGNMMDGNRGREAAEQADENSETARPLMGADLRIDAYTLLVRRRFSEVREPIKNKKEEALTKVGEKLFWVLLLFVVGLEQEERRLQQANDNDHDGSSFNRSRHSLGTHTAKDYGDAAKSVAKVLLDYTRKKLDLKSNTSPKVRSNASQQDGGLKRRKGPPAPPPLPGRGGRGIKRQVVASDADSSLSHEKPLLQIGDVLQRTRTFLADTVSPPAALLRGELISLLCDVLDIDTEMELSDEDAISSTAGGGNTAGARAGAVNDLGSAGSLLKLIVLSCPIMKSPGCESREHIDPHLLAELQRRFGRQDPVSSSDIHKLHAGNRFLAVVHRLAASRSTSARITACSLGPVLWGHLDFPHQLQLRGVITRALHDVDVMVRKATATVLHEIAELVFDPRSVPWLVLMCERAMTDPEPQLRSAAMTLTWHLAEHLPNAFFGDASQGSRYLRRLPSRDDPTFAEVYLLQCKLLPVATRLAEDRSPSVRLSVAAQSDRLCDALGAHWSSVVIDTLLALLSDADERVRCEAVACVPRLAQIVLLSTNPGEAAPSETSILEALIPASIKLQKDSSVSVRVSLAAAAGDLLTLLVSLQSHGLETSDHSGELDIGTPYKKHVDDRLIPMVQILLNDSDPEVTSSALRAVTNATRSSSHQSRTRHASVASLDDDSASISSYASERPVVQPVLSEKQVLRLLPTLTELGNSKQWRVRQSAVEIVPALLGCTQQLETRSEIAKLCVRLMNDKADAVRKTAAECLCMGGSSLGSHGEDAAAEWISSLVIPNIRKAAAHSASKQRLLSLKMVESVLLNGACPVIWKGDYLVELRMTDSPIRELAAIALSLANDRIPNVRLNVGRCLEAVMHVFEEEEVSFIKTVLAQQLQAEKELENGGDTDVLYFAQRCLARANNIQEDKQRLAV